MGEDSICSFECLADLTTGFIHIIPLVSRWKEEVVVSFLERRTRRLARKRILFSEKSCKMFIDCEAMIYTMDTRNLLVQGFGLLLDPATLTMPVDEFLGKYGGYIDYIALVAKSPEGVAYYPSNSAPRHNSFEGFFPVVSSIANDIGIRVYAIIYTTTDGFLGNDPNFRMVRSGGVPVSGHVCPAQETYWQYIASLGVEVASYDVEGIILKDVLYPHEAYCFCDTCRQRFSLDMDLTDRDFGLEYLRRAPNLLAKWREARAKNIEDLVRTVVQTVQAEKRIEVLPELVLEKQIGFADGAYAFYGQNFARLIETTNHVMFSLNPWSQEMPARGIPEHEELLKMLEPYKELARSGLKTSLFVVQPSENSLETIESIRVHLGSEAVIVQDTLPRDYLEKRSMFLGLGL